MLSNNIYTESYFNEKELLNLKGFHKIIKLNFIDNKGNNKNIIVTEFNNDIYEKYYNSLIKNQIVLNDNIVKYHYKPDLVSYEYYNTILLDHLILYMNKCYSKIDFKPINLIIPNINDVYKMLKDKYKESDIEYIENYYIVESNIINVEL